MHNYGAAHTRCAASCKINAATHREEASTNHCVQGEADGNDNDDDAHTVRACTLHLGPHLSTLLLTEAGSPQDVPAQVQRKHGVEQAHTT